MGVVGCVCSLSLDHIVVVSEYTWTRCTFMYAAVEVAAAPVVVAVVVVVVVERKK